jgi:hypothetical protein
VHSPVHVATVIIAVAPYLPATQGVQVPAPVRLYCPAAQVAAVAVIDPATQAYPAVQAPVHVDTVRPVVEPYLPASHGPEHTAVVRPVVEPNLPAGHAAVHNATLSPVVEPYLPVGHAVHDVAVVVVLYLPRAHCQR